jgi:hypothetical protein
MGTIKIKGLVFRGTHYGSVGVYAHERRGTYAGGRKGGVAHGEGVLTWSNGSTYSGQFADGEWHGHREAHWANGDVYYELYERGKLVHFARVRRNGDCDYERGELVHYALVWPDGACDYDGEPCGADHADFAALKDAAQQAGVRMPPTRIQRNARAVGRNRRTRRSVFALRSVLVPRVGPRLWACVCKGARVYVCVRPCARVPARACICACVSVHDRVFVCACVGVNLYVRVSVHMRLGVCERVYMCDFVCVCA